MNAHRRGSGDHRVGVGTHAVAKRLGYSALALCAVLLVVGSLGCQQPSQAKQDDAKLKPLEPPFESLRVFVEPNERSSVDPKLKELQRVVNVLKPGHWTSLLVQTQANREAFAGELESTPQNARRRPVDLEQSPFWASTTRAVALPKGQRKQFETLFFPPRPRGDAPTTGPTWIGNRLTGSDGLDLQTEPITHMPSFQYHMVVLARVPASYRYLNDLPSVRPSTDFTLTNVLDRCYYRVELPQVGQRVALASHTLCWTSTAYVIWDDVLPTALEPEQRQALVDWLHWGGGLLISGPDSLDKLAGSFLADYLPATSTSAGPLDPARLAEFHGQWNVAGDAGAVLGAREGHRWSGVELALRPGAASVGATAGLVAERRVGRGRVLVTAFRLNEPELLAWRSFDSFFNGCLLGRPPRRYDATVRRFEFASPRAPNPFDARLTSGVRYLSRDEADAKAEAAHAAAEIHVADEHNPAAPAEAAVDEYQVAADETELVDKLKAESGVGGWNDFSPMSNAARQTLREAAGISVPGRSFVLKMIGLYLLVVVPVNWLVFRLLGRVEWAWLAVPVIALAAGVVVVWAAQLDIGFARAETEVALLELQPGYARGHLTRYTALYSSLSTRYDLEFDDPSALALPFSSDGPMLADQSSREVTFTTLGKHTLGGYPVASNSTGMVHAEQMCDLGGSVRWEPTPDSPDGSPGKVINGTRLKLVAAAVVRRTRDGDGELIDEMAFIGELAPGASAELRFEPYHPHQLAVARDGEPLSRRSTGGALTLRRLMHLADDPRGLKPGEMRLVACHDGRLPGIRVAPGSSQARAATLTVAHLEHAPRAEPQRDVNLRPERPDSEPF